MGKGGNGNDWDVWLWDGSAEYEGKLVKLGERDFTARVRMPKKRETAVTGLGRRLTTSWMDEQRRFVGAKFLAHFKGTPEGTLFEAEFENVQRSSVGAFDFLLSGRFCELDGSRLDALRRVSVDAAAAMLKRHVG